jgi:hypothetical protein
MVGYCAAVLQAGSVIVREAGSDTWYEPNGREK